jgi:hypothetical protein
LHVRHYALLSGHITSSWLLSSAWLSLRLFCFLPSYFIILILLHRFSFVVLLLCVAPICSFEMLRSRAAWALPLLAVATASGTPHKAPILQKETADSDAAWITYNWAVEVNLGGQVLPLLVDTGSSDL